MLTALCSCMLCFMQYHTFLRCPQMPDSESSCFYTLLLFCKSQVFHKNMHDAAAFLSALQQLLY